MSEDRANKDDLLDFLSKGEAWQAIRGMDAPGLATELDAAGFRRTEPQSDAAKDERVVRYLATATPEPMSEYTPTTEEIREYVETGGEPRPWVALDDAEKSREQARVAAFDRWLAAHDAEVRAGVVAEEPASTDTFEDGYQAAIADVRWLADARDRYVDERVQFQTSSVRQVADIVNGENDAAGWLPSWLWDEWAAKCRYQVPVTQEGTEQ